MKTEKPGVFRAWVLASRPKTLAAAAVPVLVGCALAYSDGCFRWPEALLCTLFALLMQIDANLINDLFDYLKGSDRGDRLGPRRACAEGWIAPRAMKRGILCTTLVACVAGLGLLRYGGPELIAVGAVCVLFAFLYTAGPYPLAYHGWGDLLVVLFFGFVPVGCIYYIMCHSWTADAAVASLACGLAIDTLLMLNNYRDREQDALSGKRTLVVVHALQNAAPEARERLVEILSSKERDPEVLAEAVAIMEETGSIDYARTFAEDLTLNAKARLAGALPPSQYRDLLVSMADWFVNRLK